MESNILTFNPNRKKKTVEQPTAVKDRGVASWLANDFRNYYEEQKAIYGKDMAWDMLFRKILEREFGDPVQLDEDGFPFMW